MKGTLGGALLAALVCVMILCGGRDNEREQLRELDVATAKQELEAARVELATMTKAHDELQALAEQDNAKVAELENRVEDLLKKLRPERQKVMTLTRHATRLEGELKMSRLLLEDERKERRLSETQSAKKLVKQLTRITTLERQVLALQTELRAARARPRP